MHEPGDEQNNRGNVSEELTRDRRAEENYELYRQIEEVPRATMATVAMRWLQLAAQQHPGIFMVAGTQLAVVIMAVLEVRSTLPYWLVAAVYLSGLMFEIFRVRHEATRRTRKSADQPGGARPRP